MKTYTKFIVALTVIMAVLTLIPQTVFAAEFPKPENYVADEAGILSEDTISLIKETNKTLSADLKMTIAVCTVSSTNGEDIAEYARKLFSEWKMGDGILILIAKDDNSYYFVPSTGIEDILSNDEIAAIRDEYFEADFANGVYERAVMKVVNKFKNTLVSGVATREAEEAAKNAENTTDEETEKKGTTVGGAIVGFFKTILIIALVLVVLFIALFVWAMFNDDVAAILQKLIFKRNKNTSRVPQNYYDERLYGNGNGNGRPNSAARRRPNANGNYPTQGNGYGNGYANGNRGGYNGQGYANGGQNYRNAPVNRGSYGQNGYPANNNPYGQQNYQNRGASYGAGTQGYNNAQGYGNSQNPYGTQGYNNNPQGYNNSQNPYGTQGYNNNPQGYAQGNGNSQSSYDGNAGSYNRGNIPQNDGEKTVQFNIPRRG